MKTLAVALALSLLLAACGTTSPSAAPPSAAQATVANPAAAAGDHVLTLAFGGEQRRYEVHAPPGFTPAAKLPLVVVLHYRDGSPGRMREMTRFDAKADQEGFLVAYPEGVNGAFNALVCCGTADDVGFVKAVVGDLIASWGADPARVYATGISNGADMSFRLAVEAPGVFAAIAPVSGGFLGTKAADDPAFAPSKPVSVISIVGSADRQISGFSAGLAAWQRKAGCTATAAEWADPGKTLSRAAATCANGTEVVDYTVRGMGHSWPGGTTAGLGDPTTQANAVDLMWAFFAAHPRQP